MLVQEILLPNAAIRNLIREDKIHQIYSSMQSGQAEHGMKTFNQDLVRLVVEQQISVETAMTSSSDKKEIVAMLERAQLAPGKAPATDSGRRFQRVRGRR